MDILAKTQSNFDTFIKDYIDTLLSSGLEDLGKLLETLDDVLASSRPKHLTIVHKK